MKNLARKKQVLPAFPRTPHLPYQPNLGPGDEIAGSDRSMFTQQICVEEKIDACSVGMTLFEDEPLIRNRDHIISKGYVKDTAAKKQLASIWGWFYEHKKQFETLTEMGEYALYGEWCIAAHGIHYTSLPDWLIAYDIYDYGKRLFLPSPQAREIIEQLGFTTPRLHHLGSFDRHDDDYEKLTEWANTPAQWADEKSEGVYIKVYNDHEITDRFKMVRTDFERGKYWNPRSMIRNGFA